MEGRRGGREREKRKERQRNRDGVRKNIRCPRVGYLDARRISKLA